MISVIIPTYNRLEKLQKTLEAFGRQTLSKKDFEVIVIDDGGSDGTKDCIESFRESTRLNLKYFYLDHRGPGRARNIGAQKALFPIVFFCGDDTYPDKNLLNIHLAGHRQKKGVAVLGIALWDESEKVTDFMRWLAPAGPQFHFNNIKNHNSAGFDHFYTCNISLEKKWLETEKFDEQFECAFEDIELGLRLEKKGLKIFFDPEAKVFHSHFYDEERFGERMKRVGKAAAMLFRKYENDKATLNRIKMKYAPFCFFPGLRTFGWLSNILAESVIIKFFSRRGHWFWSVCRSYSEGMIGYASFKINKNR
jgi:glycosyltransferase involved in cell wall biosynthesis